MTGPVQVYVDLTRFAAGATRAQLRDRVRELEDVGATGVSVSDHIFFTAGGRPRTEGVGHGCDPLTTLAAVRISLSEEAGIAAAPPDPVRFCREVLPLLG